jgi:DNA-binding MarR family transcriptional regulator
VSVAEWVVLRDLYEHKTALASELAGRLGMTRGGISKLIDRLEAKTLITRTTRADDARYQTLALSKGGRDLVPALSALADENDAVFFGHLDAAERGRLADAMKSIVRQRELRIVPVD